MSKAKKGSLEEYWKEDADRVNALSEAADRMGIKIDVKETTPPLNEDGSLASEEDQ